MIVWEVISQMDFKAVLGVAFVLFLEGVILYCVGKVP